eukprot:CCRYP_004725-RA/>CCRYP_004725-RA protein AED:0.38 eAED:0.38 QI:0/0/0/1/1/1/2/0/279
MDKESDGTAMPVLDQDTGQLLEHKQLRRHPKHKATWDTSYSNELAAYAKALANIPYINTKSALTAPTPSSRSSIGTSQHKGDVTYTRVRSFHYRCFASFNISNFYLGTPLDRPEYVRIKLSDIPDDFVQEYSSTTLHTTGMFISVSPKASMPLNGKRILPIMPQPPRSLHKWRPVLFVLIVDDFGIQYSNHRHAEHLLQAYNSITQSPLTGQAPSLQASTSSGTTTNEPAAHHGHITFRPATEVHHPDHVNLSMPHINTEKSSTAPRNSSSLITTPVHR